MRLSHRTDIYVKSIHGTMVVWLQNNGGYGRWGPTESRVDALLESFRPVRDKERDKSFAAAATPAEDATIASAAATTTAANTTTFTVATTTTITTSSTVNATGTQETTAASPAAAAAVSSTMETISKTVVPATV